MTSLAATRERRQPQANTRYVVEELPKKQASKKANARKDNKQTEKLTTRKRKKQELDDGDGWTALMIQALESKDAKKIEDTHSKKYLQYIFDIVDEDELRRNGFTEFRNKPLSHFAKFIVELYDIVSKVFNQLPRAQETETAVPRVTSSRSKTKEAVATQASSTLDYRDTQFRMPELPPTGTWSQDTCQIFSTKTLILLWTGSDGKRVKFGMAKWIARSIIGRNYPTISDPDKWSSVSIQALEPEFEKFKLPYEGDEEVGHGSIVAWPTVDLVERDVFEEFSSGVKEKLDEFRDDNVMLSSLPSFSQQKRNRMACLMTDVECEERNAKKVRAEPLSSCNSPSSQSSPSSLAADELHTLNDQIEDLKKEVKCLRETIETLEHYKAKFSELSSQITKFKRMGADFLGQMEELGRCGSSTKHTSLIPVEFGKTTKEVIVSVLSRVSKWQKQNQALAMWLLLLGETAGFEFDKYNYCNHGTPDTLAYGKRRISDGLRKTICVSAHTYIDCLARAAKSEDISFRIGKAFSEIQKLKRQGISPYKLLGDEYDELNDDGSIVDEVNDCEDGGVKGGGRKKVKPYRIRFDDDDTHYMDCFDVFE